MSLNGLDLPWNLEREAFHNCCNYRLFHEFHFCNEMSGFPGALVDELIGCPRVALTRRNEATTANLYCMIGLVCCYLARLQVSLSSNQTNRYKFMSQLLNLPEIIKMLQIVSSSVVIVLLYRDVSRPRVHHYDKFELIGVWSYQRNDTIQCVVSVQTLYFTILCHKFLVQKTISWLLTEFDLDFLPIVWTIFIFLQLCQIHSVTSVLQK